MKWIIFSFVLILASCCPGLNCVLLDDSIRCNFDTSTSGLAFKATDLDTIWVSRRGPLVKGIDIHQYHYKKGTFTKDSLPLQSGIMTLPLAYTSDTVEVLISNGKKFVITNYVVETKSDRTPGGCQKCPNIDIFELDINNKKYSLLKNSEDNSTGINIAGGFIIFRNKL
jgi:hypothetical protein